MPRTAKSSSKSNKAKNGGGNLVLEATLWAAAYKVHNNMDTAENGHVAPGPVFLQYISDASEEQHNTLRADSETNPEAAGTYMTENISRDHVGPTGTVGKMKHLVWGLE